MTKIAYILVLPAALAAALTASRSLAGPSVTVTNSDDSPAITSDVNNPGRAPYQSLNDQSGKCSGTLCRFIFTAPVIHEIETAIDCV
jgi:hypothetical protein